MTACRVLIAEDQKELRELIIQKLTDEGFEPTGSGTGAKALELVREWIPSVIILDIGLPDVDGVSVCQEARKLTEAPILMLTADSSPATAVRALGSGATDYVRKPVDLDELVARMRAALRSVEDIAGEDDVVRAGALRVDERRMIATYASREIELSTAELRLLAFMARNRDLVLSKQELLDALWEGDRDPHVVEAHISNIRRKLRGAGCEEELIRTVHGAGYKLAPP